GRQEGLLEATRVAIAEVLRARFGPVPTAGLERVNQIRDESQLRRLLQGAASLQSWGSFEELLEELG
ncbi:transposase, partial [Limnospira fusiformis NRMCF6962]